MNSEQESRWGVLYCPKHGKAKRWKRIEKCLKEKGIIYDFVQSESTGSVERLMRMLINNGYKTIVLVGGDSALNDAVNCLMEAEPSVRESIALGVIPNGLINDFARYWGFRESEVEQTVEWLSQRRIRKVDLGCIRYMNKKGERCRRYFLNCVNIGLTASIMNLRRRTRMGMGSCQGKLCACRAASLLCKAGGDAETVLADLASFMNERWKGMRPVAWGSTLSEAQLTTLIYEGLYGLKMNNSKQ